MRLVKTLLLGSVLALSAACGGDDGDDDGNNTPDAAAGQDAAAVDAPAAATFTLTVNLNGFGQAHNGDTVYFDLWDDANTTAAVASSSVDIMGGGGGGGGGGGNMIEFTDGLTEGHAYTLYFYADVDGNMTCDGPAGNMDHAWSLAIPTVTAAVTEDYMHNGTFDGDCTKH